ncbi:FluC/FEX family fluoride channel [Corynebacterium alimapuense]|nr:CrcB family protein [Corynebacterium alimapuense]
MLLPVLAVGAGGFLGGIGRWTLGRWPGGLRGTYTANIAAVTIFALALSGPNLLVLALGTGFAGALSTWSTLAKEIGQLIKSRSYRHALVYAAATLLIGIGVVVIIT